MVELRNVQVVYNSDYCPPVVDGQATDQSAVAQSAIDVCQGLRDAGLQADILAVRGPDLLACVKELGVRGADLVFNLVESLAESSRHEPVFPGVLDVLDVAYTGSPPASLALCLNKPRAKAVLDAVGVPTPQSIAIESLAHLAHVCEAAQLGAQGEGKLLPPFPLFAKLACEDASVGINNTNVIRDIVGLKSRVASLLHEYQQPVLLERFISGRELNVTLLDQIGAASAMARGAATLPPQMLPIHEIDFSAMPVGRPHIVTYEAKWDESSPEYGGTTPVPVTDLPAPLMLEIERVARLSFRALGLRDYARVDFRIGDGIPYVIDVNPNCDVSPGAGVARAAKAAGLEYPQLVRRVCEIAWERARRARAQRTAA